MAVAVPPFWQGVGITAADLLRKHHSGFPTTIKSKPTNKSSYYDIVSRSNYSTFNSIHPKLVCFKSLSNEHPRRSYSIQARTQAGPNEDSPLLKKVSDFGHVWLKFLRPYAVLGTVAASISVYARVIVTENQDLFRWYLLIKALPGLIALICGNAYYIGINQIYDVDIDKVNKPELPIASGELSMKSAWLLTIIYLVAGLLIVGLNAEPLVTSLYSFGIFLGTIYSVPPIRLKRSSISTALTLSTVRGVLINVGVYYATKTTLGLTFMWSPALVFIITFTTLLLMVIAISKDITDVEGDTKFQIVTFAAKFGVRNIAMLSTGILLLNYIGAILVPICMPQAFNRNFMVTSHAILALWLLFQTLMLEQAKYTQEASANFYQVIWKLLYAEYIIYPFI